MSPEVSQLEKEETGLEMAKQGENRAKAKKEMNGRTLWLGDGIFEPPLVERSLRLQGLLPVKEKVIPLLIPMRNENGRPCKQVNGLMA